MCEAPDSIDRKDNNPKYVDLLSESDRGVYIQLRSKLSSHICRNRRGKRIETFAEILSSVQNYCIRGSIDDDRHRCLVCGVCWVNSGIAVNTRQLGILIGKCKSSINGSLQKLGYITLPSRSNSFDSLIEVLPMLKSNFLEVREWTVRLLCTKKTLPALPNINASPMYSSISPSINVKSYSNINNESNQKVNSSISQILPSTMFDKNEYIKNNISHHNDITHFGRNNSCTNLDKYSSHNSTIQRSSSTAINMHTNLQNSILLGNNTFETNPNTQNCNHNSNFPYSSSSQDDTQSSVDLKTQERINSPDIREIIKTGNTSEQIIERELESVENKCSFEFEEDESAENENNSIFCGDSFSLTPIFLINTPNEETDPTLFSLF